MTASRVKVVLKLEVHEDDDDWKPKTLNSFAPQRQEIKVEVRIYSAP